jgi:putative ATP-binding cassette transporter
MHKTGFLKAFWALAKPYWVSEQRGKGLGLLVAVVALTLGMVGLNVMITNWYNDFYNMLQEKRSDDFLPLIGFFLLLAFGYIVAAVYRLYLRQMLQIEWRTWMNERFLADWLKDRAYYQLQLLDRGTDNPDQRIAEDLKKVVDLTLVLGLGILNSVVTFISFVALLWTLSGPLDLWGFHIPGYMVWAAVLYAIAGSAFTHYIGRPLLGLNFNQQRYEADYRFSLVRLRENAEGVALYRGEQEELGNFRGRFTAVIGNWWGLMRKQKQLNFFTISYAQIAIIFPFVVAAPRYFAGKIQLGALMQISSAFDNVRGALSWFIDSYTDFAEWKATSDRLIGFSRALDDAREAAARIDGERVDAPEEKLALDGMSLALPSGRALLAPESLEMRKGEDVLITGPSGSGKSTFFRALAGIWPYWKGRIGLPRGARLLFLPQKPYLPIGALKHAVSYPEDAGRFPDEQVAEALKAVGLESLAADLARSENWAQVLSGGEQQRLAFARALLARPDWLFLDEATASLPEDAQDALYRTLKQRLPGTTLVSIGHRGSLAALHARRLQWRGESLAPA